MTQEVHQLRSIKAALPWSLELPVNRILTRGFCVRVCVRACVPVKGNKHGRTDEHTHFPIVTRGKNQKIKTKSGRGGRRPNQPTKPTAHEHRRQHVVTGTESRQL